MLHQMKRGDVLICAELSRLGRSLLMIMAILNECMKNEIQVWTIKDNYRLGSDISWHLPLVYQPKSNAI